MLQNFTGKPYHKSLAYPLASIIIAHILLTENKDLFVENSLFFPMPISKQKKKELGYNPPLLLSKELNSFFKANSSQERVFLVDTIFSDPSLMEEKAKYFKEKGASLVYGVTVARDEV